MTDKKAGPTQDQINEAVEMLKAELQNPALAKAIEKDLAEDRKKQIKAHSVEFRAWQDLKELWKTFVRREGGEADTARIIQDADHDPQIAADVIATNFLKWALVETGAPDLDALDDAVNLILALHGRGAEAWATGERIELAPKTYDQLKDAAGYNDRFPPEGDQ